MTADAFPQAVERLRAWEHGDPVYTDGSTSLRGDVSVVLRAVAPLARAPLTAKQAELLAFIREEVRTKGRAPSFSEIARAFGYRSLATVSEHLTNLAAKGCIRRDFNATRGIVVMEAYGS